ncbi:PAAR domain-containing protein [Shewanella khirikhana]|uniref:PAAR domain-containing protein n=1 Tax=Shewanella khirikhana TaxID=1965282 RepID=UPI0030D39011
MPKAARLGDSCAGHGCFPATPIIVGSGDVSINGKPAARKGDAVLLHACPCPNMPHGVHGRSISAGSSTVSINGKPAARVGDAIGCGGSVSAGSGDVLIGDTPFQSPATPCGEACAKEGEALIRLLPAAVMSDAYWGTPGAWIARLKNPVNSVAERKARYEARKTLAAANVEPESGPKAAAAKRLAFNNDSILRAEAAQYVYSLDEYRRGHSQALPELPIGLEVPDTSSIPGLEDAVFWDEESGFGAGLFKSNINGETMLTFRGTNNGVTGGKDWATNGQQGIGQESAQYNQAMDLAELFQQSGIEKNVIVGHSLGGGLAASAVGVTGLPGYTFNAAGLHPNTVARRGGLPMAEIDNLIQTQSVDGEVLTGIQKGRGLLLPGLLGGLGGLLFGPVGATVGTLGAAVLFKKDALPEAAGEMHSLPGTGLNPVSRHGMAQVIAGIEKQKVEDIDILTGTVG